MPFARAIQRPTRRAHAIGFVTALSALVAIALPAPASAQTVGESSASHLARVLTLQDYNTRVVVIGTTLLGLAAGVIGTFAYLRKRALMGDALSHATLPGIATAFILTQTKDFGLLSIGAAVTGVLGVISVIILRRFSRLKEDAALGAVLSVFFGAGIVLLSIIQGMGTGHEAGLGTFIYGQSASMLRVEAERIGFTAVAVVLASILLFKEFRVVCFDSAFAASQGWPVVAIDLLMMALVVLTTVFGLQAVGLILVVALLILPPATARFWTDRLILMTILAGAFGAISGWLGSTVSALMPRMPTGAVIVLVAGVFFVFSMLGSPHRGMLAAVARRRSLSRKVQRQHLLRALIEHEERRGEGVPIGFPTLLAIRSWSPRELERMLNSAQQRSEIVVAEDHTITLTSEGRSQARRILRNHRLWEMYLIKYADVAPSHVDRDADEVEHVLHEDLVAELERELAAIRAIPPSPHGPSSGLPVVEC